jgi:hypothetical protein
MITLVSGQFGWDYLIVNDDGKDIYIQSDWDYPDYARTFGWQPCHNVTDGTIDCTVCGKTASELIYEAQQFLDDNIGESVNDPGYF